MKGPFAPIRGRRWAPAEVSPLPSGERAANEANGLIRGVRGAAFHRALAEPLNPSSAPAATAFAVVRYGAPSPLRGEGTQTQHLWLGANP